MNSLVMFYKKNIKENMSRIKAAKKEILALRIKIKHAKITNESTESLFQLLWKQEFIIIKLRPDARYYNLAYSVIRCKDIFRVELNPRVPHDPKILEKFIQDRQSDFNKENSTIAV